MRHNGVSRALALGLVALAALAAGLMFAGPVHAAPAQTTPTSSGPPSTTASLLEGTTAAVTTTTIPRNQKGAVTAKAARDNRRVQYVVAALLGVALLLAALTIWYWFRTRPVPPPPRAGPTNRANGPGPRGGGGAPRANRPDPLPEAAAATAVVATVASKQVEATPANRRPRPSVAGLDHVTIDDDWSPRATGELPRINPTGIRKSARPSRPAREATIRAARPASDPDQG